LQLRCARGRHQGSSNAAQCRGIESGRGNGVNGSTVRIVTGRKPRPRLCDQVLEPTRRPLAADMFEGDQPACGHERPPDLGEGRSYIINRAEHQPDVRRVETVVRKRFRVSFRPSSMALVFAIDALAISLLGSVPPARRVARLNIIEAVSVE
jgi:hypothetical protein